MKTRFFTWLACVLALLGSVRADGFIIIRNPHPRSLPPVTIPEHRPPIQAALELVSHRVDVRIEGQRATTHVEQEFFNPNGVTIEGEYWFPIPKGAHLDRFTMRVGDQEMEAELLDAAKARRIYEDIVRSQRDPALLEYTDRAAFRIRIFPIEARGRKKVTLSYTELLKVDCGLAAYVHPLSSAKFSTQPPQITRVRVTLDGATPIKALYSPSHAVGIVREGPHRAVVTWEARNVRAEVDFQLLYSTAQTEMGIHLLTHKREGEEGWFLLLASPGAEAIKGEGVQPKDVVFVMDTSGSMAGAKLAQLKKAMGFCIENLNDGDRFELVRFSTESEALFEKLSEASRANRERALQFIQGLKPIGGTAIADALERALSLRPSEASRPFIVVFLTDGKPTVGETDEDRIVARIARDRGAATRVFCFGIGTDINTHLLDKITERTRAASQFVLPEEDLEIKVSSFFTKIKEPLLTNLRIEFPSGIRVSKSYPAELPDLFRGDQLVVAGRFSGEGEGDLVIEGSANGQLRRIVQRIRFSAGAGQEFIAQLWAMRRVGWVLDEMRLRGESAELRDEVVDLARRYAIVTPYTSYLIVEDEARRGVPLSSRTLQRLDRDTETQMYFRKSLGDLSQKRDGYDAALAGRAAEALKNADAPSSALARSKLEAVNGVITGNVAPAEAQAAGGQSYSYDGAGALKPAAKPLPSTVAQVGQRIAAVEQQTRWVRGKTFAQNGATWSDSAVQALPKDAKRNRVQFASREYFELLEQKPETAPWLALGGNVTFALVDEVFEIYE